MSYACFGGAEMVKRMQHDGAQDTSCEDSWVGVSLAAW